MNEIQYKNRKTLLVVLGILEILIGCLALLILGLSLLATAIPSSAGHQTQTKDILFSSVSMGGAALFFGTMGVGSILARRWARALMLIAAWFWLAVGMIIVGVFWIGSASLSAAMEQNGATATPGGSALIITFVIVFSVVVNILTPGLFILFYSGRNVRLTCEAYNPNPSWTDKVPLPVLGASLYLLFAAVSSLLGQLSYVAVFPLFGRLVTGMPGLVCYILFAAVWIYCAIGFYKLNPRAWLIAVVVLLIFTASSAMTFESLSPEDLYAAMGMAPEQIQQINKYAGFQSSLMKRAYLYSLPWLLYLIWIKRYFKPAVS